MHQHVRGLTLTAALVALWATPADAADFTLRLHTLVTSPHPYNDMAAHMETALEERSDGRIDVRIFDGATLGNDPAVIGEITLGTIDLMISTAGNISQQVPEYNIFSLPYLFSDYDTMMVTVGPGSAVEAYFRDVYEERQIGAVLLALGGSGSRNLSTAEVPVNALADIQGLKMRTPPTPMISRTWEALGTLPVTVAWAELYAAMQTGVAEALESSIPGYMGSKLYEVAPNLALTAHTIQINHITMSARSWNALPADLQALVQEVAIEANALGLEKAKEYEGAFVETLENEHGVTVTRPDVSEFQAKLAPVQEELADEFGLAEPLALVRDAS